MRIDRVFIRRCESAFAPSYENAPVNTILLILTILLSSTHATKLHADTRRVSDIRSPQNFTRAKVRGGSFQAFLRNLPLKAPGTPVRYFDGSLKPDQSLHHAVIDIDVGKYNLQQCADAVMRLRGEYLFHNGKKNRIQFNFTSGDPFIYQKWARGYRPRIRGSRVRFILKGRPDYSYQNFKKYLTMTFRYAGTWSLSKEMIPVRNIQSIKAGDVFIQGGFPGHAVIVVDTALHENTGEKIFLIAQSYMPAQSIHVLKNLNKPAISPWYSANFHKRLETPEWTFKKSDLKRFRP